MRHHRHGVADAEQQLLVEAEKTVHRGDWNSGVNVDCSDARGEFNDLNSKSGPSKRPLQCRSGKPDRRIPADDGD